MYPRPSVSPPPSAFYRTTPDGRTAPVRSCCRGEYWIFKTFLSEETFASCTTCWGGGLRRRWNLAHLTFSYFLSPSLCLSLSLSVSFSLILARGLSRGSIAPCTVCGRQIWFYENHGIVWKMWIIVSFWILLGCDSMCHNAVRSLWFLQEELTRSW